MQKVLTTHLPQEEYIKRAFHYYGIIIEDHGRYNGFIKKSDIDIYFPIITNGDISLRRENMRRSGATCMRFLKMMFNEDMKEHPEYYQELYDIMERGRKRWEAERKEHSKCQK